MNIEIPGFKTSRDFPSKNKLIIRYLWGIERSGFFNGQGKWAKGFENQMV